MTDPLLPSEADLPAFLRGGGVAARRIAARDWTRHPMGPPEAWPQGFRTAISLVVNSVESMILCWGPDLHFFFNDAYAPLLGPRVEWAMGARFDEVWADALDQAMPIIDDAMAGRPRRFFDLPWRLATDRGEADTWWTFSYSRILADDGSPAGLFIFTNETTAAVRSAAARDEAEALLRRSEEAGGIGLFAFHADGRTRVTPAFCQLFGLPVQTSFDAAMLAGLIEPADRHRAALVGLLDRGEPMPDAEYRIRRADTGELRWIARRGEVEHNPDGSFLRFAGVVRDITDQVAVRDALAAEREQLAQMFEQAPTFMAILRGPDHRFERVNPGYEAITGHRAIIGQPLAQTLPETTEQGFVATLDEVYRTGRPFSATGIPYAREGAPGEPAVTFYVDLVFQPLRNAAGEVTGIFVEGADVTARTEAAAALAEAQARYRTLLTSIEIGFCVIEMRFEGDRAVDYRIVEANPAFEAQTGMPAPIGRWTSDFAPDLERHWFDTYGQVVRTQQSVRFENEAKVFARWYDVTALPTGDPAAQQVAILFNDITKTKTLEAELRRLNRRLAGEVDARTRERDRLWTISSDPFLIADTNGVWLSASPAWTDILGWSTEELIGKTSEWLNHPDDQAVTKEEIASLSIGLPTRKFENRFRTRDGDYRWFSWTAVEDHGLLFCNARDVTVEKEQAAELARAEEQLRQALKVEAVGQLTGGVAHDFNNLLTVIRGSAELLRRPDLSEDRRARYVEAIADTAERATRLTNQLLAFARRQALKPEIFDAGHSVDALREMIGTLSGPRIEVAIHKPEQPCFIHADRSQFDTAIVNMAVNARDAMDGSGALTIAIGTARGVPARPGYPGVSGDFTTVRLSDTGTGIPADRIGQIFEPFFSTKGPGHGTGLGLSQVFGFARQSGGEVTVDSEVGRGATFTLYLPRAADPGPEPSRTDADRAVAADAQGCLLVVEDNDDVGSFAVQALEELGYRTVRARSGDEALDILAQDAARFDAVFSDVVMPGISGIELGQTVRRLYPRLPVVLTSGYSDILAADARHGFDLVHKPYSLAQLATVLAKVLGSTR